MTTAQLKIHSENILPIIKRWLYSDRDIFVRELVSNACDAIKKLRVLREQGETDATDEQMRVDVTIDAEAKTLTFADTGIGMTADEVERYIAQIAFSGAEEFVEKYKSKSDSEQIIGHFGLGFYSSFMVSDKVEISTLSYQPKSKSAYWSCDGSTEYQIEEGDRSERGTSVILHIGDEDKEFLDATVLRPILERHCRYLPTPIYLNGNRINPSEPLWVKKPSDCSKQDYLEFYRSLYPMDDEPLFWVHLNVDYPFHLQGILYFPKFKRDLDPRRSTVSLYSNRVFVADNCKDILPEYLTVLRGAIDSPDIPLNVSRNALQMDRTVRQLAAHISKKVADSLAALHRDDRERYIACWPDIEVITKLGALEDPKFFERVKDLIIWKTTADEWVTAEQYLERYGDKTEKKLYYLHSADIAQPILKAYREKGIEALIANRMLDPHVQSFLESKMDGAQFVRMDGTTEGALLDPSREKNVLDADGRSEAAHIADTFKQLLDRGEVDVKAKSLASDHLPGYIVFEEQQRRLRDILSSQQGGGTAMQFGQPTYVVNTNSPIISAIQQLKTQDEGLAKEVANQLYDLSLLSQRELNPEDLNHYIERSTQLLEHLLKKA